MAQRNKSSEYWAKRFELLEESQHEIGVQCFADIEGQYRLAQKEIEKEIAKWYTRFAENNSITMQQARKLLTDKQLEEFKWDVNEYIRYGEENAISGTWAKQLENASARYHISRLEALKIHTQHHLEVLFGNQLDYIDAAMRDAYVHSYNHTAYEIQKGIGVGWDFAKLDENKISKVINRPWAVDGKNFSERIWGNGQRLVKQLHSELTSNIVLGKDPQKSILSIAKKMETSKAAAGKLIMTESAFFSTAGQKDCFTELDVEEFEVIETLDSHTCSQCGDMDGKHFPMAEWIVGVTVPPFHPWCRGTTAPYFEDDFDVVGERAARDADGKTYYVPADMTYEQWKKQYVDSPVKVDQTQWVTKKQYDTSFNGYPVNRKLVNSKEYHDKFEALTQHKSANESLYQQAMQILEHRDGTELEDIVALDARTGKIITKNILSVQPGKTGFTKEQYKVFEKHSGDIIILHNHPNGSRPSATDIKTLFNNESVVATIAVGHDGSVHIISKPNRKINVDRKWDKLYNEYVEVVNNKDLAEHYATDVLYKAKIFDYESR